jgi:hypothetical protein
MLASLQNMPRLIERKNRRQVIVMCRDMTCAR